MQDLRGSPLQAELHAELRLRRSAVGRSGSQFCRLLVQAGRLVEVGGADQALVLFDGARGVQVGQCLQGNRLFQWPVVV